MGLDLVTYAMDSTFRSAIQSVPHVQNINIASDPASPPNGQMKQQLWNANSKKTLQDKYNIPKQSRVSNS